MYDLSVLDALGMLGVALYLGAYASLQLGLVRGQGYFYAAINAAAAALVLLSLQEKFNISSAVIQVSWITISLVGIVRYYILTHRSRLNAEEAEFVNHAFPYMEKMHARQFLSSGDWCSGGEGAILCHQGELLESLIYLSSGSAEVNVEGKVVAYLTAGDFVGDVTALSGDPATATVTLNESSRYFSIPVGELRQLVGRNNEIRFHVQAALAHHVSSKLKRANDSAVVYRDKIAHEVFAE